MNQIDAIKEMQRAGKGPQEISDKLKIDRKTVTKYMALENYNPELTPQKIYPSKLDSWKGIIDGWLDEDKRMRFKQRHTAKRIQERLLKEYPGVYDCSYPLIQRYCKQRKETLEAGCRGYLELVWHPGEAQADFGEVDCYEDEELKVFKFLCLTLPGSNAGYAQLFRGESAECITQGLKDIFERMAGVPRRIVFDNATAVGRRAGDKIRFSEVFLRFKWHYGFDVTFCNPYSGHEKGNVENKVGYIRRNLFVPAPAVEDIEVFNDELFVRCEQDWQRAHYKKHQLISRLFKEDQSALSPLPAKPFHVVRFEKAKADGYGKICLDGKHWYSSSPEMADMVIIAAIGAHYVEIFNEAGASIVRHRRVFGEKRTDSTDWTTSISKLIKNPGAWKNSGLRSSLAAELRDSMDSMDDAGLKNALRIVRDLNQKYNFETACEAMSQAAKHNSLDGYSATVIAARILSDGLACKPETGPDLSSYDKQLIVSGGRP